MRVHPFLLHIHPSGPPGFVGGPIRLRRAAGGIVGLGVSPGCIFKAGGVSM